MSAAIRASKRGAGAQLPGLEDQGADAALPGALERQLDAAVVEAAQAIGRQGGTGSVGSELERRIDWSGMRDLGRGVF